jgi:hypothetical protein
VEKAPPKLLDDLSRYRSLLRCVSDEQAELALKNLIRDIEDKLTPDEPIRT